MGDFEKERKDEMNNVAFIEQIAILVKKYAPQYGIKVCSPIIAQAILESASGTSELAVNANNFFGLKYRIGRCPTACGVYYKIGSEQNRDGTYTSSNMKWMKFQSMEDGVIGYFDFTNIPNYAAIKGVESPRLYLENIKRAGYATSLGYVDKVMNVIKKYALTKYDVINETIYIVQKGDYLSKIAAKFNLNYMEIANYNGIKNPSLIRVGQVLKIPYKSSTEIPLCKDEKPYELKENLAHKSNYGGERSLSSIRYIVIHYTGNDGDSDEANGKYFNGMNRGASAHYFVDDDSITRSVPDNFVAWHCGTKNKYYHPECRNSNSIGIEMCDTQKNGRYNLSAKTRANVISLTRELMKKYNIPIQNVIRHYDVTHKKCPAYFVSDAAGWVQFLNELAT